MSSQLVTLTTERLRIRPITMQDVDGLFAIFSDPEVMTYWSHAPYTERPQAETLVKEIAELAEGGRLLEWGVAWQETDELIGTFTLSSINHDHRRAEVGYSLAKKAWGQGYAQEVMRAMLRHGFETMNLHRLEADVDPENKPSIRLLERVGFQKEGYLPQRWFVGGQFHDTVLFGLLRTQWERNQS